MVPEGRCASAPCSQLIPLQLAHVVRGMVQYPQRSSAYSVTCISLVRTAPIPGHNLTRNVPYAPTPKHTYAIEEGRMQSILVRCSCLPDTPRLAP